MNRSYNLTAEGLATIAKNNVLIEVPATGSETDIQNRIDAALLNAALRNLKIDQLRDDVYVDGEIVRQDYTIGTGKGKALLNTLKSILPTEYNYNRSDTNVIGLYSGYREPYVNASISWYDFGIKPSESLLLSFNTSYLNSNLKDWYGIKFDLVTREQLLKVVVNNIDEAPALPVGDTFYALTHSKDGTTSDWVDAYIYATPKRVREFCEDNNLIYPLPTDTHIECDVVWCWGFVFNKTTLEYGPVKAYARYNQG